MLGFKLLAGALSSCAFIGVAIGVGLVFASLVYSIARNPAQKNELLRYAFIGFSLVEASGMIGLVPLYYLQLIYYHSQTLISYEPLCLFEMFVSQPLILYLYNHYI